MLPQVDPLTFHKPTPAQGQQTHGVCLTTLVSRIHDRCWWAIKTYFLLEPRLALESVSHTSPDSYY